MNIKIEKSLNRTLNRVLRKARVENIENFHIWSQRSDCLTLGNFILTPYYTGNPGIVSNREYRRIKGALPELRRKMQKTMTACNCHVDIVFCDYLEKYDTSIFWQENTLAIKRDS